MKVLESGIYIIYISIHIIGYIDLRSPDSLDLIHTNISSMGFIYSHQIYLMEIKGDYNYLMIRIHLLYHIIIS